MAGQKHRERDPEHGYVRRLQIDAVDQAGRLVRLIRWCSVPHRNLARSPASGTSAIRGTDGPPTRVALTPCNLM